MFKSFDSDYEADFERSLPSIPGETWETRYTNGGGAAMGWLIVALGIAVFSIVVTMMCRPDSSAQTRYGLQMNVPGVTTGRDFASCVDSSNGSPVSV